MSGMLEALRTFHEEPADVSSVPTTRGTWAAVSGTTATSTCSTRRRPPGATRSTWIWRRPARPRRKSRRRAGPGPPPEIAGARRRLRGRGQRRRPLLPAVPGAGDSWSTTLGKTRHSDPSFLTVLLQDGVGGLQVLLGGRWVRVPPVPGAFVVNIGDFLQLMSNDKFKSVEHRVVAVDAGAPPRVSVACFFRPRGAAASTRVYGPIPTDTLGTKPPSPPRYRSTTAVEFINHYMGKGHVSKSALKHFRI
ncbi:unnamed protein product [Miscanthus lutarioriparius]|uniref:Fe2OG dioxygenase domain-containing protein n=1 Tax=Miscanthus lutarioriparius TaxID=422564 RepID=A0A811QMQ5_9POAL|nr:unnamed protein product [Miscanthus lutarioriparius]